MAEFFTHLDHSTNAWAAGLGWPMEGLLRLLLAIVAGGLVGLEREVRGRQAGFRTNLLVCMGSALVMIVSIRFAAYPWRSNGFNINIDPARIAYGVMTGIGFLGAGTIIKSNGSVHGLTTSAALWCVAALGLSAGFGMYVLTLLATIFMLFVLWIFDYLEEKIPKARRRTVVIRRRWTPNCIAETVRRLESSGMEVLEAGFDRREDPSIVDITLGISYVSAGRHDSLKRQIEDDGESQVVETHAG